MQQKRKKEQTLEKSPESDPSHAKPGVLKPQSVDHWDAMSAVPLSQILHLHCVHMKAEQL